jgi:hypothetical protein
MARYKKVTIKGPVWTTELREAYRWCINNGIKIAPWAASSERDNYYWWIDVEVNGAKKRSPFKYNGNQLNEKIFELYKFYYDKNKIRNSK